MKNRFRKITAVFLVVVMVVIMIPVATISVNAGSVIESAIAWAIDIANDDSHLYSQSVRWGPSYDCSSFVISAYNAAGVDTGSASWTGNMIDQFTKHGFIWIDWSQIGNVSNLQRGDVLLYHDSNNTSTAHTEIYLGNNMNVGAHSAKRPAADQISVSGYYWHPWHGVLRYAESNPPTGTRTISDGSYHIVSALDNTKALNVDLGSVNDGANIDLYGNLSDETQVFNITYLGNGYYKIINKHSERSLDVDNASTLPGTNLKQYGYYGSDAQQWIIKESGDGEYFYIISKCNGLYIDVENGIAVDRNNVHMYTGNESYSQKWKFIRWGASTGRTISDGEYHIITKLDRNKGIDVYQGKTDDTTNIDIYENLESEEQVFQITYLNNGYYKIINKNSGKSLDCAGGKTISGTNVQQYTYTGVDQQKWIIKPTGDGNSFYIISKNSGLYLDVSGGISENFRNVQTYIGNESDSQKWQFIAWGSSVGRTIKDGSYHIVTMLDTTKGLDVYNGLSENGTNIDLYSNIGSKEQMFNVTYVGNGYYKILNSKTEKSIDCDGGKAVSGTNIQQYTYTGENQQLWIIKPTNDQKSYNIISKNGGQCIDVTNGKTANFTNIQTWIVNGSTAQKWLFVSDISDYSVTLDDNVFIYDSTAKTPTVIVKNDTVTLVKDSDYTVEYSNNINAGTATVTVTGIGNYTGTLTKTFIINKAPQTVNATISSNIIDIGDISEITASGYGTISYTSSNTNVATVNNSGIVTGISAGTATITVTATGNNNYNEASKTFTVLVKSAHVLGDVNGDGMISISDAAELQEYLVNLITFDDEQFAAADADGDGRVSIGDVTKIQQYLANIITSLG